MASTDPRTIVEETLSRRGISLVGYAAVYDLPQGIDDRDEYWGVEFCRDDLIENIYRTLPEAQTVVVFGIRLLPEADIRIRIPNARGDRIMVPYVSYLAEAAQRVVTQLERAGYPSERFPRGWGFKHYARAARLGYLGRHRMIISPEYGARMRYHALLTTARISHRRPAPEIECDSCSACMEVCPSGAITDEGLIRTRCLTFGPSPEPVITYCSLCIEACHQAHHG